MPTGAALYAPIFEAGGDLVDFRFVRLNPAGQRLLSLPAQPPRTFREYYPTSVPTGIFDQYRTAYLTGQASTYDVPYEGDGLDTYFRLVAQRSGELLVVNFTDMGDLPHAAAEQALRAGRAREQAARAEAERQRGELERVFEQAPVAIAVYRGPTYTIELANPTVARLWGRTRAQLIGKGLFEALPEVAGLGYEELLDGVMATGKPHVAQAMEAQHERNGQRETVYWDFVYVPVHAPDGRINGVMVVANEVTTQVLARRQAEQLNAELENRVQQRTQELAEQQRLLSQILAQVPAAIATLSEPAHFFTFANARYQHLVGGRAHLGQSLAQALPELTEQGFIEVLDSVYRSGQAFEGKEIAVLLALPGQPPVQQYFDFTYQPLSDAHGQTRGILAFAVDVTEQVRARRQAEAMQAALLAAAQRRAQERQDLLDLFERAPVAVALLRAPDHQLDYTNSSFAQLFPGAPARGVTLVAAYPTLATATLVNRLDRVYQTGETYQGTEVLLPTATPGPARYFTFTLQAYQEHDRMAGVAVFVHEVSEQVHARQQVQALNQDLTAAVGELHESNTQLRHTNSDLDSFIYTASHDLKAPIANIEGLLLALRQDLPAEAVATPPIGRLFDLMDGAVIRFQQTLEHLTSIMQLQKGSAPPAEEVDLVTLIEGVRLDLAPALEAAQAQLLLDTASCASVRFAPKNLRSIVFNLLSNALKYRDPHRPPVVQLRASCTAQHTRLEVQDNGLGLAPAQQALLFQLFRRLHDHVEGSGVGLFAVKKIVENAGGTIMVESELGVGTTFCVVLPR